MPSCPCLRGIRVASVGLVTEMFAEHCTTTGRCLKNSLGPGLLAAPSQCLKINGNPLFKQTTTAILLLLYFPSRHTRDTRRRSSNLTGTKTCAMPYHVPALTTTTNQPAPAPTGFSSAVIAKTTDEQFNQVRFDFIIN